MPNNGRKIVTTLKEIIAPGNPGAGNATGQTKPNVVGDPDYIAPSTDLSACPVAAGTACPVVYAKGGGQRVDFEFNLASSVLNNPAIAKVRVVTNRFGAGMQDETIYDLPHSAYFAGAFTGLAAGTYSIDIYYLNSSDAEVSSCLNAANNLNVTG
jgi:hypothetical protein